MKSKEQLIADYAHDFRNMHLSETELEGMLTSFGNEIIEKLIEEVPDNLQALGNGRKAKYQLRAKWLGKDSHAE